MVCFHEEGDEDIDERCCVSGFRRNEQNEFVYGTNYTWIFSPKLIKWNLIG